TQSLLTFLTRREQALLDVINATIHLLHSLSFYIFFFYSSDHLQDLHSFPTRRSSDLQLAKAYEASENWLSAAQQLQKLIEMAPQDRKSTRLNSSHVAISYAVFCLKKKKTMVTKGVKRCNVISELKRICVDQLVYAVVA